MEYSEEEGKIGKGPLQPPIFLKNSMGSHPAAMSLLTSCRGGYDRTLHFPLGMLSLSDTDIPRGTEDWGGFSQSATNCVCLTVLDVNPE